MRGDSPGLTSRASYASAPHARGFTFEGLVNVRPPRLRGDFPYISPEAVHSVCPVCAGIYPALPRNVANTFTPHARGFPVPCPKNPRRNRVSPACAGIYRLLISAEKTANRLPRLRGDFPCPSMIATSKSPSAPHARGFPGVAKFSKDFTYVCPVCAGIYRDNPNQLFDVCPACAGIYPA